MATFRFKLMGHPLAPRGRIYTINDNGVNRIVAAYKAVAPQVPSGPPNPETGIVPMRVMTDPEVVDWLFDGLMLGVLNNGDNYTRSDVAKIAHNAVVKDTFTTASDNT